MGASAIVGACSSSSSATSVKAARYGRTATTYCTAHVRWLLLRRRILRSGVLSQALSVISGSITAEEEGEEWVGPLPLSHGVFHGVIRLRHVLGELLDAVNHLRVPRRSGAHAAQADADDQVQRDARANPVRYV